MTYLLICNVVLSDDLTAGSKELGDDGVITAVETAI
jgi:hypothetical protein